MRERVLAIVSFIAQYVMEEKDFLSEHDIVEQLLEEGFEVEEIDAAFTWMEHLALQGRRRETAQSLTLPTQRIFTPEENLALSQPARGFLIRLRSLGILDDELQEEIIEKALQMEDDEITLREIKALTALTLFTRAHGDWRREVDCFMDDDWSRMYH